MAEVIRLDERARRPRAEQQRQRCVALTAKGQRCRNFAPAGAAYCSVHAAERASMERHPSGGEFGALALSEPAAPLREERPVTDDNPLAGLAEFVRRRLSGEYPVDDFGYDEELSREILLPLVRPLYETYFRVRTFGVERVPSRGAALLVANHSGTVPLDAIMVQYAVATEHPGKRVVRNVAADLAFRLPFIGPLARKTGNALASEEDTYELLRRGELVAVFPEGYKGTGKGWRERYRLQRFGRGGFIEVALRSGTPIVPVAIVGAEEAYPMLANARFLARTFGFPYFPITPTFPLLGPLGLLPLPSKWVIEFGDAIPMDDYPDEAADDAMLVFDLADRVRDTIQQMLYRNLNIRRGNFI